MRNDIYINLRHKKSLSNYEISRRTGIAQSRLSEFESGKHTDLRISTVMKLADALDVSLDDLVEKKVKSHEKERM